MTIILLFILSVSAFAQTAPQENQCRSQLARMNIDRRALNEAVLNNNGLEGRILPSIRSYVGSDAFRNTFVTDYPLEPVGFPYDKATCEREKARDAAFRGIDCNDPLLCSSSSTSEDVKNRLCFPLPCSFLLGSRMNECAAGAQARPTRMLFNSPISLRRLDLVPEDVTMRNNQIRSCFLIRALDVNFGVGVEFDNRARQYEQIGLNNMNINLDGPRRVCMTAQIDFTKNPPLSGVVLEHVGGQPFVSNAMIDAGLRSSTISGLSSGYSPEALEILKLSGLPPLARHFRPTIEGAIAQVLGTTFETSVSTYLSTLSSPTGPTRVDTPANSMISELGIGNFAVKKYVDLLDCALLRAERAAIPADHACLTTAFSGQRPERYTTRNIPTPAQAAEKLQSAMSRTTNVTSETLRARLAAMEGRMRARNLAPLYQRSIAPLVTQIAAAQSNSTLLSGIELVGQLSNSPELSVGFCLPEICDQERPSAHEGRSIPNCQIQTYVDINELNNLLKAMYDSGRLCSQGRGDFVPQRDARGQVVRENGFARGTGCVMALEEGNPNGFRCYLNGPPRMQFDPRTRRYNVDLRTRECYRGPVFAGQGRIGGDIDFTIGFTPSICNGGDFCLENGEAQWGVVPGTARDGLRDSSFLNGIVRRTIDSQLRETFSKAIRFPVSSTEGPLASIPIIPDGRTDMGDGYFGACLKIR